MIYKFKLIRADPFVDPKGDMVSLPGPKRMTFLEVQVGPKPRITRFWVRLLASAQDLAVSDDILLLRPLPCYSKGIHIYKGKI
jgi:hypothetical protein